MLLLVAFLGVTKANNKSVITTVISYGIQFTSLWYWCNLYTVESWTLLIWSWAKINRCLELEPESEEPLLPGLTSVIYAKRKLASPPDKTSSALTQIVKDLIILNIVCIETPPLRPSDTLQDDDIVTLKVIDTFGSLSLPPSFVYQILQHFFRSISITEIHCQTLW